MSFSQEVSIIIGIHKPRVPDVVKPTHAADYAH